ncbi:MAG TPA: sugar phosphate isomerase/epimerase family protein [Acidimicrobiales bacterium]|nr:sugar phosphate isomerase/epimerase family protein [Acidimicrobiales bacterium]
MRICYSNLACPDWQFERTVEAVFTYGFDGLEIRLFDGEVVTPDLPAQARRRAEQALSSAGVSVAALDSSLQVTAEDEGKFLADLVGMCEIAEQWGAPLLRVFGGPLPKGAAERRQAMERAGRLLAKAAPLAGRYRVRLALETHDHFSSAHTVAAVLDLAGGAAGAVYDSHHPYRMGESPGEVLSVLGRHVWHVQAKDARRLPGDDQWQLVPLGEGEVPVEEMVRLLPEAGYDGWLSLEFEKKWHPELAPPEVALAPQARLLREWAG